MTRSFMRVCRWAGCFRKLPLGGRLGFCSDHQAMADEWTCPVCNKLVSPGDHETTGTIIYHRACYMPQVGAK